MTSTLMDQRSIEINITEHSDFSSPSSLSRSSDLPPPAGYTPPTRRASTSQGTPMPTQQHLKAMTAATLLLPATTGPFSSPLFCGPTPVSTPVHSTSYPHSPSPSAIEFATETFTSEYDSTPTSTIPASALPVQPSTIKGGLTSFMGKITHNPEKQQAGNAMIACRQEEKANFFDQKAIEWERKGNMNKAQKNREKAMRYRQKAQTRLHQPLTAPVNKTEAKTDKAARLDAKALECERKGDLQGAQKCRHKSYQLRQKHGLSHPIGAGATAPIAPTL